MCVIKGEVKRRGKGGGWGVQAKKGVAGGGVVTQILFIIIDGNKGVQKGGGDVASELEEGAGG